MINRVLTLIEETHGTPIMTQTGTDAQGMPIMTQTGWKDPWYIPALSNFPGASHVSYEDGTIYIVYGPAVNRCHWHQMILFRQSAGVYGVFGTDAVIKAISGTAKPLTQYAAQDVHAWRMYACDGTDAAIDPMTSKVIGAFTGRIVTFTEQPPKTINKAKPYVVGKIYIEKITPILTTTCGQVDMVAVVKKADDGVDDPKEKQPITAQAVGNKTDGKIVADDSAPPKGVKALKG
jgi:hypothetical protein